MSHSLRHNYSIGLTLGYVAIHMWVVDYVEGERVSLVVCLCNYSLVNDFQIEV